MYLELVDPALLEPVAFSYIDCQAFSGSVLLPVFNVLNIQKTLGSIKKASYFIIWRQDVSILQLVFRLN